MFSTMLTDGESNAAAERQARIGGPIDGLTNTSLTDWLRPSPDVGSTPSLIIHNLLQDTEPN